MDFLPGKSCAAVPLLMQEGWRGGGGGGERQDVNNALQGMRLVRSRGYGEFKGICVCHTNQEVSLHSEANLNRRARTEDDTTFSTGLGPEKEAVGEKVREEARVCVCKIETPKGRERKIGRAKESNVSLS